jgi:hypothetical protein
LPEQHHPPSVHAAPVGAQAQLPSVHWAEQQAVSLLQLCPMASQTHTPFWQSPSAQACVALHAVLDGVAAQAP